MNETGLKSALLSCKVDIDRQINALVKAGEAAGVEAVDMKYIDGKYILPDLLLAKSNVLNGLSSLALKETQARYAASVRAAGGRR